MTQEQRIEFLGKPPHARLLAEFAETRKRGYSVSGSKTYAGMTARYFLRTFNSAH